MQRSANRTAWSVDQLGKSEFFHKRLHDWLVVDTGKSIAGIKGEDLDWDQEVLEISEEAWNKVIHRGIRPVLAFAHPDVLCRVPYAVAYYRMLSMVSQKSMTRIGLDTKRYEQAQKNEALPRLPDREDAVAFARHFNKLVSRLIEADAVVQAEEFDLWRGMAAGSQAQGSWHNNKGKAAENVIRNSIRNRLQNKGLLDSESASELEQVLMLKDGRKVEFGDEPDIAFYQGTQVVAAIEVKGGIDVAGILERIGATLKSLSRAKLENPAALTVLIVPAVSMTATGEAELKKHSDTIDTWFATEDIINDEEIEERFFKRLGI